MTPVRRITTPALRQGQGFLAVVESKAHQVPQPALAAQLLGAVEEGSALDADVEAEARAQVDGRIVVHKRHLVMVAGCLEFRAPRAVEGEVLDLPHLGPGGSQGAAGTVVPVGSEEDPGLVYGEAGGDSGAGRQRETGVAAVLARLDLWWRAGEGSRIAAPRSVAVVANRGLASEGKQRASLMERC